MEKHDDGASKAGARKIAMMGPDIEALSRKAFPEAKVSVADLAGDGDHHGARVIPLAFTIKSRSSIRCVCDAQRDNG
ncbi:BolA family transcriptional regulator [Bradyrhizobium sp. SRL28]|uniref:BolA family transcriptional regulator n=1 Tax=Bradyrhizobium sp. SRL28 TaxID=2836178 RepID=UPI00201BB971|nr:BolA family transcriptional regulator [Bradyrhizobium sp. SRL28]